jgi:ribosome-binding factor A
MGKPRPERVQEALRQEVSSIVHDELKDPRLGFITITRVALTKDLRYARIYFSVLGTESQKKRALYGLRSAKGFIKNLISERIKLKFMPEIEFKIDDSLDHAKHVLDLIEHLKKERESGEGNRGDKKV